MSSQGENIKRERAAILSELDALKAESRKRSAAMAAMCVDVERLLAILVSRDKEIDELRRRLDLAESDAMLSPREQAVAAGYHHQQPSVVGCPQCIGLTKCTRCERGSRT